MTNYFFIGDGTEVLACEAWEANARDELKRLQAETDDALNLYSCDPTSLTRDSSGAVVFEFPAEYDVASKDYDLPTLAECVARETANS